MWWIPRTVHFVDYRKKKLFLLFDCVHVNSDISSIKNLNSFEKSLAYRWKLNAFRTKYSKNVSCVCGNLISRKHILNCVDLKRHLPSIQNVPINSVFAQSSLLQAFFKELRASPIGSLL